MDNLDSHSESDTSSEGADMKSEEDETIFEEQNLEQNEEKIVKEEEKLPQFEGELMQKVHKEYQIIYIAAYTPIYRQRLQQLAYQYSCDLSFIKNTYIVSCKDKSKHKSWLICKQEIKNYFNQIVYVKIDEADRKFRMYNSPEVNRCIFFLTTDANQRFVYFCQFNSEYYVHSDSYSQNDLKEKKKEIYKYANIFTVCFLKKKVLQAIDIQIANFYQVVLKEYYAERFQKNNLVVEINKLQKSFYILGKPGASQHQMMEAKKTVKSLIEGITIVAFKKVETDIKQQAKFKEYLKRISKFPITFGKLSETIIVLISKDNILKELLKKKDKIISKAGITENTSLGIFIPHCYSKDEKKEQINKICKEMGYDFWQIWGVRYFRPMISSDGEPRDQFETLELIIQIISGFMEVKDKYDIMKDKKQPQNKMDALKKKQLQQQSKYAYMLNNAAKDSKQMTKILRRDVMEDQVMMKKRYNAIYSIIQGQEIGPFYIEKLQYDKGVDRGDIKLIKQQNLKKGQFFETYLKINDFSIDTKNIEELQSVLITELKKLKQAAKSEKSQAKGFDKDRKIAHMIKKLLVVF